MYLKTKFELEDVLFTFSVSSPSEVPLFVLPSILSARAFYSLAQDLIYLCMYIIYTQPNQYPHAN